MVPSIRTRLFLLLLILATPGLAQTVSSVMSGAWNNPNTWGGVVPDFSNSTSIRIQSGHVVNVPSGYSVQVDQFQIRVGGQLVIDNGGVLDVVNASGNDLIIFTGSPNGFMTVNGTLELSQGAAIVNFNGVSSTVTDASTVTVNGTYRHKYTTSSGTMLGASWQAGSTAEITGFTSNSSRPLNLNQAYHHFTWNCPAQTGVVDLKGNLATVNGNLSIISTGGAATGNLRFFYADNNVTMNIGGNLTISGSSGVWFTGTGTGNVVNITGDLLIDNAINQLTAREGSVTINCNDLSILNAAGSLSLASFASSSSVINITGNLNTTGKLNSGMGIGTINFAGSSPTVQTISGNGTIGKVNFSINSGAIVDVGTNSIRGTGALTVSAGAELRVGDLNASGAIQNVTTAGNIRVAVASRTYSTQATIVYNGAGAQVIGAGHPIVNTTIRTNTTLLTNNLTVMNVSLESGTLSAGNRTLNVRGNWNVNGGTFSPGTGAVIFSGTSSLQGSGPFAFSTFNVSATGTVAMGSASASVTANFTLTAGAVFNAGTSTVTFTGANTQTINANGNTLYNITVDKTAGDVTVANSLFLAGTLTMQSASNFRTNGLLTLLSTDDSPTALDGNIAALPAGASIIGNVTVQRYMSTADNYDRFISMPVSNATVAQLQDDFAVTGSFTGTSYPCTGCTNNGASLKRYVESVTGTFSKGYTGVPVDGADNSTTLTPGVGYDTYMWNGVAPITLDVTGPINRGTINFTISHTASSPAVPTADGWNLVGNPYPSAIQWNNGAGWSRTNVDPTVWVWDVVGRLWRTYNYNTLAGNLANGVIAMGQGFWVYVPTPGAASMSINEQAKSAAGTGVYYRQRPVADAGLKISLLKDGFTDDAFLVLNEDATENFDSGVDCPKLELGIERMHVSLLEGEKSLASYAVNDGFSQDIPLRVRADKEGTYQLSFSQTLSGIEKYYLVDRVTEKSISLEKPVKYSFSYKMDQPESRFYLTTTPIKQKTSSEAIVSLFPNPTSGNVTVEVVGDDVRNIEVMNNAGMLIERFNSLETSEGAFEKSLNLSTQPSGIYVIKIVTEKTVIVRRILKN